MEYFLRDNNGVCKARITADLATRLMNECDCHTDGRRVVFDSAMVFTTHMQNIELCIWEGDYLSPLRRRLT